MRPSETYLHINTHTQVKHVIKHRICLETTVSVFYDPFDSVRFSVCPHTFNQRILFDVYYDSGRNGIFPRYSNHSHMDLDNFDVFYHLYSEPKL